MGNAAAGALGPGAFVGVTTTPGAKTGGTSPSELDEQPARPALRKRSSVTQDIRTRSPDLLSWIVLERSARVQPRRPLNRLQKFAHGTALHTQWYGMRSVVESSSKVLKGSRFENLGDPGRRPGRGFAFQYLIATLMAVSANIRKIASFFVDDARSQAGGPLPRVRRRKTVAGTPLERASESLPLAPPQ